VETWKCHEVREHTHDGCEIRGVCRRENDCRLQVVGSPFFSMTFVRGHPEHLPLTFGAFPPLGWRTLERAGRLVADPFCERNLLRSYHWYRLMKILGGYGFKSYNGSRIVYPSAWLSGSPRRLCRMLCESQSSLILTVFYSSGWWLAFLLRRESSMLFSYSARRRFDFWRLDMAAMRL
jgi:hypothetical protein